jgi:hypothetical protein
MRHSTATHQITLLGPEEGRCYCYFTVMVGRHGLDHWGRLIDGEVDGGWAASRRGGRDEVD